MKYNKKSRDSIMDCVEQNDLVGLNKFISKMVYDSLPNKTFINMFYYKFNLLKNKDLVGKELARNNNEALLLAVKNKNLKIINRLLEFDAVTNGVAVDNDVFVAAIKTGEISIVKRLLQIKAVESNITSEDNLFFRVAVEGNHVGIKGLLLHYSEVFKLAALNVENSTVIINFIKDFILDVKKTDHSFGFVILNAKEADLGFYMYRYLVSINVGYEYDRAIEYLSSIPIVREINNNLLAHPELADELDPFATQYSRGNEPENSMINFNELENSSISKIKNRYEETLNSYAGDNHANKIDAVIESLANYISKKYKDAPAVIKLKVDGQEKKISLPLLWEDLNKICAEMGIEKGTREYKKILKMYYKHGVHTAYRFLLKPNNWLDVKSKFAVACDGGKCTDFENVKEQLAYFWLAVSDIKIGSKLECFDRVNTFIYLLGQINRAHNQDNITDDQRPDKPSCKIGIPRRLFEAVTGHPLTSPLPETVVAEVLNKFVGEYYRKLLVDMVAADKDEFVQIYNKVAKSETENCFIDNDGYPEISDIPRTKINELYSEIEIEYPNISKEVIKSVNKALKDNIDARSPQDGHFFNLYTRCSLGPILKQVYEGCSPKEKMSKHGPA